MPPATSSAREQADLLALFTAIAQRDQSAIQRMLVTTPAVAHVAASSGATRQDPKRYFFESIARYAYAGDAPLPLAAASHDPELATQLLAMKANVH